MKTKRMESFFIFIYLAVESLILAAIKIYETPWQGQTLKTVMYAAILCNAVVAAWFYFKYGRKLADRHENLVFFALLATAAAQVFVTLIGTEELELPGLIILVAVEFIYAAYLKSSVKSLLIAAAVYIAVLAVMYFTGILTLIRALEMLNVTLLFFKAFAAWFEHEFRPSLLFRIGITLFLFSDVCIVLSGLTTGTVHDAAAFLVWIFLIPSQALITTSYVNNVRSAASK